MEAGLHGKQGQSHPEHRDMMGDLGARNRLVAAPGGRYDLALAGVAPIKAHSTVHDS